MNDAISRLAVIQIIEKMRARIGHNLERSVGKSIIEILDDVGRDVDRLPSALGTNLASLGTDLISRQAAIKDAESWVGMNWYEQHLQRNVVEWLKEFPPAEPKRAKWERHYSRPGVFADLCWHCSACGYKSSDGWANKFNFCPNCGAYMRGEQDG